MVKEIWQNVTATSNEAFDHTLQLLSYKAVWVVWGQKTDMKWIRLTFSKSTTTVSFTNMQHIKEFCNNFYFSDLHSKKLSTRICGHCCVMKCHWLFSLNFNKNHFIYYKNGIISSDISWDTTKAGLLLHYNTVANWDLNKQTKLGRLSLCCNNASWQINLTPFESLFISLLNGTTFVRNMHVWDEQQS